MRTCPPSIIFIRFTTTIYKKIQPDQILHLFIPKISITYQLSSFIILSYNIMLLTNNHHKDILSSPRTPLHTPIRRNSHTAKTNSRLSTPNATRTISLKPEQPSKMSPPIRMNRSSQLFLNNDLSTDVPEALGKLDRVKL